MADGYLFFKGGNALESCVNTRTRLWICWGYF